MDITISTNSLTLLDVEAIIIPIYTNMPLDKNHAELDANLGGWLQSSLSNVSKAGDTVVLHTHGKISPAYVVLVGMGEKGEKFDQETARRAGAWGIQKARQLKTKRAALSIPDAELIRWMVEGAVLANYQYLGQKTIDAQRNTIETLHVIVNEDNKTNKSAAQTGQAFAEGTAIARDLANLPPNICTPDYLAQRAEQLGETNGFQVKVLGRQQMQTLKMGALLAVAQGSATEPRFIIMEYTHPSCQNKPPLVLIGKGITFDTGGYSLKTAEGMVSMKGDMSGGAAVIGAMYTIAKLKLLVRVVGLVPAADNLVSRDAYRPSDVVTASNGKTIEIVSTDAEGRLLLADALVYAKRYNPEAVVDIATLTGSMGLALGDVMAGYYSTDETLAAQLEQAASASAEHLWRMPLVSDYFKPLQSDTADMKNSGGTAGRYGGANIAAQFLKQFVDYPRWAHIDMAGVMTSSGDIPYAPKGASGFGARLLAAWVLSTSQSEGEA